MHEPRTPQGRGFEAPVSLGRVGGVAAAVAFAAVLGCGAGYELDTAPVSGVVTVDGEPLTGGTIYFTTGRGRGAGAKIQPDGSYELRTYRDGDGAAVGLNKVGVTAYDNMALYYQQAAGESAGGGRPRPLIPPKYFDPETSGLEFDVKAGKRNQADFDLPRFRGRSGDKGRRRSR